MELSRMPRLNAAFFFGQGWPYLLVPLIPVAIVLDLANASAGIVFATSALGIIPTAALMGRATEELAARSGPGIGGLLNVTFGNAPELIIALFALGHGLHELVKASLIGSIIGNTLLVMGAAFFVGGIGRQEQRFAKTAVSVQTTMLLAAATALVMPAIFELTEGKGLPMPSAERVDFGSTVEHLSIVVAAVLLDIYVAQVVWTIHSNRLR
jgi:Ca2+:H+ antiporter